MERVQADGVLFDQPYELGYAAKRFSREILEVAAAHHVSLEQGNAVPAIEAAVTGGYLRCVQVEVSPTVAPLRVVDGADLLSHIGLLFGDVATGKISLGQDSNSSQRSRAKPRQSRKFLLIQQAARFPIARALAERYFRRSPELLFRHLRTGPFKPQQHSAEISQLLRLAQRARPRAVLEIGTANGGTTYLLSRYVADDALIVTCDLTPKVSPQSFQRIARRRQRIEALALDSHTPEGEERIRSFFPDGVDLLFIDGDHTYEGVRQDFLTYIDLLKRGGLLVFHDIVEDYKTRFGISTGAWVGGVPRFWRELSDALPSGYVANEFVFNMDQNGLGIGVVRCPDRVDAGRDLRAAYLARARP